MVASGMDPPLAPFLLRKRVKDRTDHSIRSRVLRL